MMMLGRLAANAEEAKAKLRRLADHLQTEVETIFFVILLVVHRELYVTRSLLSSYA